MKKVLIYGKSNKALKELPAILLKYEVVGFVVSSSGDFGENILGLPTYHYKIINSLTFDMVIICSMFADQIASNLKEIGVKNFVNSKDLEEIQSFSTAFENQRTQLRHQARSNENKKIPLVALEYKHIANCILLTDRDELIRKLPKNGFAAELGVANGDFTESILRNNNPSSLHLVDIWESERYNESLFNNVIDKFTQEINKGKVKIHREFSEIAATKFPDNFFDWVYIDTTHSYEQTKLELELYSQKIKPDGIIAGHDYILGNWVDDYRYGVIEAVHEFCKNYNYRIKYLTMDLSEFQSFAIEKI